MLHQLENNNLLSELELEQIKASFFAGDITRMNVAPVFAISREWNLNNVVQWEENHELEDRMIEELNILLTAWGEKL